MKKRSTIFLSIGGALAVAAIPAITLVSGGCDSTPTGTVDTVDKAKAALNELTTTTLPGRVFVQVELGTSTAPVSFNQANATKIGVTLPDFASNIVVNVYKVGADDPADNKVVYGINDTKNPGLIQTVTVAFKSSTVDVDFLAQAQKYIAADAQASSSLTDAAFTAVVANYTDLSLDNFSKFKTDLGLKYDETTIPGAPTTSTSVIRGFGAVKVSNSKVVTFTMTGTLGDKVFVPVTFKTFAS